MVTTWHCKVCRNGQAYDKYTSHKCTEGGTRHKHNFFQCTGDDCQACIPSVVAPSEGKGALLVPYLTFLLVFSSSVVRQM